MSATMKLPPTMQRSASFRPDTYDEKTRSVEVVFATESPVMRSTWDGDWQEVLGLADGECDLSYLGRAGSVFYGHGMGHGYSAASLSRSHIGTVENPRITTQAGARVAVATLRFSERAEVADIIADMRSGILKGVSAGYHVDLFEDVTPKAPATPTQHAEKAQSARVRTLRATKWFPKEISLTPMPADVESSVRSNTDGLNETSDLVPVIRSDDAAGASSENTPASIPSEESKMPAPANSTEATRTESAPPPAPAAPPATDPAALQRAVDDATRNERQRGDWIRTQVRRFELGDELADELVRSNVTNDVAKDRILEALAASSKKERVQSVVRVGDEARDKVNVAVEQAMLIRAGVIPADKADPSNMLVGAPLLRMGEEMLRASGHKFTSYSPGEIARLMLRAAGGALGSTDFPKITANVAGKSLRQKYALQEASYRMISRQVPATDFKPLSLLNLGFGGPPIEVGEHGEIKQTVMTEASETYSLKTYAKLLVITRQMLINDDAGAFSSIPGVLGANLALFENKVAWALITANTVLSDGIALFNAAHNNELASGADYVLSQASLSNLRAKLRLQVDPDLNRLNLPPKFLIVPAALETTAQRETGATSPTITAGFNPFAGTQVIVVPELDASSTVKHYMATDPAVQAVLGYSFLSGASGPTIEEFTEANFDGFKMRLLHDWAAGIIEHRAIARSNATTAAP